MAPDGGRIIHGELAVQGAALRLFTQAAVDRVAVRMLQVEGQERERRAAGPCADLERAMAAISRVAGSP
eukprot:11114999-Lingulodinium_polyedra.AAC.1